MLNKEITSVFRNDVQFSEHSLRSEGIFKNITKVYYLSISKNVTSSEII
ncbi:hypothetical protein T190115A13A_50057 [Tenacibaculum sp. 190524A02b]|uniref:Uncharacterized protein n=1 Tax=Tenacibaculum vairaonense TaxID=3137860 RepID=A0ABP1FBQ1_9FLAO